MSDPISVIAGGVAVLQVIQTIAQASELLYRYVASVRNADSSCQCLLNELSAIGGVLTTVMVIEKDDTLPPNLSNALSKLMAIDGPVANLLVELKNILPNEQALKENGKMKTISRLKWPFKEKEAGAIIDKLKKYCGEITNILAIDTWNTLKEVDREVKEANRGIQKVNRGIEELTAAQKAHKKDEERRKFLQWMNPVFCEDKHGICHGQRNLETGRWIFQTDEYKTWNVSDHAFLWLNGPPGHGKTILASTVIDEIQGTSQAEPQTLAYFYCNFRDDRTTNAAAVLRSLIVQLLQQSKDDWIAKISEKHESNIEENLDSLRNLWQQQCDAKSHPTDLGFLRKLLVEASTLVCRPILVIDALDECKDFADLVGHLGNLAEDARLRLFVTGRSEQDIQEAFHDLPTLSLKDSAEQMKADIHAHITEQLKTQKRLSRLPNELKKTILERLSGKAEGMFRWVQCQLDEIMACKSHIDIKAALNNLPAGLYETYDRIIQAIKQRGPSDDRIARSCLLWLAGTFTPLTLDQLNEAMMIEVGRSSLNPDLEVMDPMDIVAACGSLVIYNEKTGVVALSHYSVKEYLISRRPDNIFKSISDMHARICELLITYVLCDFVDEICAKLELEDKQAAIELPWPFHDVADVNKDHPLLSYAIRGWKHLGHVSDEDPCVMAALCQLNSEFLRNTKKHRVLAPDNYDYEPRWFCAYKTLPSPLFIPLEYGKLWMVESLVKQDPHLLDVDIAPGWGSPLIFAMAKNPDCLSIFLKPGVDFNKLSSFNPHLYGQYIEGDSHAPISWAAVTGSEVAVDFLLSQPDVEIPHDILHMAIMASKPLHECIRKFRQRGADVNCTVNTSTPIHYFLHGATEGFYDESILLPVVKALVEPSCNLSLQDWTARTVLHIALDGRWEDIVTYLLEQNAGLSATATLLPGIWSWAIDKTWFPKVQAAALAADQLCTRIKGKVVADTTELKRVEFSVAANADHDNLNPICTVVVSVILDSESPSLYIINADLSCCNQSLQKDIQDFPQDDSTRFEFSFDWSRRQRVSSCLFDYHQGDEVFRMVQQLTEDKDSTGTSFFLQMFKAEWSGEVFEHVAEFVLDMYRGPLP